MGTTTKASLLLLLSVIPVGAGVPIFGASFAPKVVIRALARTAFMGELPTLTQAIRKSVQMIGEALII
jgi:hypothetical protein